MPDKNTMENRYDFASSETEIYEFWEENNLFRAEASSDDDPYVIMIPPPNVTGELHMGHAVNTTLQDLLVRAHRMMGHETLWLPGTDHAGIATQNVVEKQLKEEGLSREDLSREEFLEHVWDWKEEYEQKITDQLKHLGASCDWSRKRFTMDEDYIKAINEAFIRLYEEGLIYRGKYIINWCVRCGTSLSDLEVEHEEVDGKLWHIRYPVKGEENTLTVATTRPETMLGDTAVAVHPGDDRYEFDHGKTVILPIQNRPIPVIADHFVDSSFGTGAVKVTPAHDENDYRCAERNDLDRIQVIDKDGRMTAKAGEEFEGMARFECREAVVEKLEDEGYLEKVEDYTVNQSLCYRCDTVLEPYLSNQWFVDMDPLAEPAIELGENGTPQFHPERWQEVYLDWLRDTRDWCISRQLWWGHKIPIWYCQECGEHTASVEEPDEPCEECDSTTFEQETDVLDTWFSSALWPFATLGWPEETADLEKFYPTDTLVTARDIIYLWVARMVITGLEFLDREPFEDVYINPTILNPEGRRMSKSLGTGIDPLRVVEDVGADATRFGLTLMTTGAQDIRFSPDKIEESRNLVTKMWNSFRLFFVNLDEGEKVPEDLPPETELQPEDHWILSRHNRCRKVMKQSLENFQFSDLANEFYHHFWDEFCDWYLEWAKNRLEADDGEERRNVLAVLNYLYRGIFRLIHPVTPFVTEELWQKLRTVQEKDAPESIMDLSYPVCDEDLINNDIEFSMDHIQEVVRGIREVRNRMNISPAEQVPARISPGNQETTNQLKQYRDLICRAAGVKEIAIGTDLDKPPRSAAFVRDGIEGYVPLDDLIDRDQEVERLENELEEALSELEHVKTKLDNTEFVENAPDEIVQQEVDRRDELSEKVQKLKENLSDWRDTE